MSAVKAVLVPDIGEFKDIPVIEILVKAGDRVSKDTPLVILESDKATLDVPSQEAGTVRELKVAIGTRVSRGSLLLTLERESRDEVRDPQFTVAPSPAAAAEPPATPAAANLEPVSANSEQRQTGVAPPTAAAPRPPPLVSQRIPHGSPSIRRMAREFGIDLATVKGTGPRGRILREDLQSFVKQALAAPDKLNGGGGVSGFTVLPWPQTDFAKFGPVERAPLSKIRRISGANLARNAVVIPHVTNFEDADITDLDALRRTLLTETGSSEPKLTVLPFLIKAVAVTLAKYEHFNASLEDDELVLKRYFHIGFAADTPNGLMVPVIRDVNAKGILQIARDAATLAAQARDGKLKPTDMQGGCFTISSLGGVGGTGFTPIINAPEVAILGVNRAKMRPEWDGERFRPRLILPLMLSWDHRVVDGVAAARFLVHLSTLLADFRRVLL
jgi:pyruvate dehydrogenase E2 component (dihydrolipoamide acetyltransferase)